MISREEAKIKITKCIKGEPVRTGIKLPIRPGETFMVYKIPLEYLVPNLANDRIAWRIREFEAINERKLSYEKNEDIKYVYELILKEHEKENKRTLKDLAEKGQQKVGIITSDGKIIDGNRRVALLKKLYEGEAKKYNQSIEKFRYFEAVVLNEDITEIEIRSLETQIQIGEDEKVGYDPINIYIKIDNLLKEGLNKDQISILTNFMIKEIQDKVEIFEVMNNYLEYINEPSRFSLLEGLEDHFINALSVFKKLDNKSYNVDWDYTLSDVIDFKSTVFDYMRARYEGKDFRNFLGGPVKANGVFFNKEEWKDFHNRHNNIIDEKDPENESDWKQLKKPFEGNFKKTMKRLELHLEEKDIKKAVQDINDKLDVLKVLIKEQPELDVKVIEDLKNIEKKIYSIRKEYK